MTDLSNRLGKTLAQPGEACQPVVASAVAGLSAQACAETIADSVSIDACRASICRRRICRVRV
jgi:hypothetical protein